MSSGRWCLRCLRRLESTCPSLCASRCAFRSSRLPMHCMWAASQRPGSVRASTRCEVAASVEMAPVKPIVHAAITPVIAIPKLVVGPIVFAWPSGLAKPTCTEKTYCTPATSSHSSMAASKQPSAMLRANIRAGTHKKKPKSSCTSCPHVR